MIHEAYKMRVFNSNFSFRKYSKMRSFGSGPCGLPPYGVIKRSKGLSAARHLAHVFAVRLASDDDDIWPHGDVLA